MTTNHTNENARRTAFDDAAEAVREAFAALPLDKKISTLIRVELDMLGDVADSVVSAASRAVDELGRAINNPRRSPAGSPDPTERGL
jgi:hypothetical protein